MLVASYTDSEFSTLLHRHDIIVGSFTDLCFSLENAGATCIYPTPVTGSSIRLLNTCSCLGQTVTFECVVTGGTLTVWSGTAFDCSANEISIRHSNFVGVTRSCSTIIGRGVTSNGNQYTSHLDVIMSEEIIGRTITCSVDDGNLNLIGRKTLAINDTSEFWITHPDIKAIVRHHYVILQSCVRPIYMMDWRVVVDHECMLQRSRRLYIPYLPPFVSSCE